MGKSEFLYDEEFIDVLQEIISSFIKFLVSIQDCNLDEKACFGWFKREMQHYNIECGEQVLEELAVIEEKIRVWDENAQLAQVCGNGLELWLYSHLRPNYDDENDYEQSITNKRLYEIYRQIIIARGLLDNSLSAIDGFEKALFQEQISNGVCLQTTNNLKNSNQISSSVQQVLMQQYQRHMQLDISHSMTVNEMSVCAIDDVAYCLSKNAALMGTGSLALSVALCLGKNYIENRRVGLYDTDISKAMLRPGAKSGLRLAVLGALKVGSARNALPLISGATSSGALLCLATVGVECCDAMIQYAQRKIDAQQAIDQVGRASTTGICAITMGAQGAVIGTSAIKGVVSLMPLIAPALGSTMAVPLIGTLIGSGAGIYVGSFAGREIYKHISRLAIVSKDKANATIRSVELWERCTIPIGIVHNRLKQIASPLSLTRLI